MDTFKTTGHYNKRMIFLGTLTPLPLFHRIIYGCGFVYALRLLFIACRYLSLQYAALGFLLLLCSLLPIIRAWQAIRVTLSRAKELSNNTQFTSFFEEDGLHVINVRGHENTLAYNVLRFARIYKDYIIIVSKARQYAVIFRNELSPERQQALLDFLRQKNIRISGKLS